MRCTLVCLLLAIVVPFVNAQDLGIGDATFPALGTKSFNATHYRLKLQYDPASHLLKSDVAMTATANTALSAINLDFKGFQISKITVDGIPATYSRKSSKLKVNLGKRISANHSFEVETFYSGKPTTEQSPALPTGMKSGWITFEGGVAAVCEPDLAHTWFPSNDHPLDKATFSFEIRVPANFVAIANGIRKPSADRVFRYELDKPSSTCMATVIVGRFSKLSQVGPNNLPIVSYLPSGQEPQFQDEVKKVPEYVKFLTKKLGPYPYSSFGVVVLPKSVAHVNTLMGSSALETTAIPVFGPDSVSSSTLIHELAHQWMGNCVSVRNWGDDIWWVEGFAQYSEWLLLEKDQGREAYNRQVKAVMDQVTSLPRWLKPGHLTAENLFSERSYIAGAIVFHALRQELGDEKFFQTLKGFIAKNRFGNASAKDWIETASSVSGQNMKLFFDTWLYSDTMPKIRP